MPDYSMLPDERPDEIVYTYETTVTIPFPEQHAQAARRALNAAHGYKWSATNDAPIECVNAHWLLNASQQQTVTVDVFANGERRTR